MGLEKFNWLRENRLKVYVVLLLNRLNPLLLEILKIDEVDTFDPPVQALNLPPTTRVLLVLYFYYLPYIPFSLRNVLIFISFIFVQVYSFLFLFGLEVTVKEETVWDRLVYNERTHTGKGQVPLDMRDVIYDNHRYLERQVN